MTCTQKIVAFSGLQAQRIIVNNTNFHLQVLPLFALPT